MKFSRAAKAVIIVLMLIFAGIIATGIYHYRINKRTGQSNLMVEHTNEVLYTSERVLSGLKDIETGTRGYVITGDSDFLQPYILAKDSVLKNMQVLKELVGKNNTQQPRVDALSALTAKRLDIARSVQNKRALKDYKPEDVIPILFNGKKVMDEIRDSVSEIQKEEQRQLVIRKKEYENDREDARHSIIVLIASLVILAMAMFFATRFFAMLRRSDTASMFRQNAQMLFFRTRIDEIVKSIKDPLLALDKDLHIIYYNEAIQSGIGHGKGLLNGKNIFEAFPEYTDSEIKENIELARATKQPVSFELHEQFLDKWQDVTIYPTNDDATSIYMKDASERKAYEKKLFSAMRFLEDTNQVAKIGGWEMDLVTGKIGWTHMTHVIHEMPDDFVPDLQNGLAFYKPGKSRDAITAMVDDAVKNQSGWDATLQIVTGQGNEKWIRTVGKVVIEDGKAISVVGTFQDVDEEKKKSDELRLNVQRFRSAFDNSLDGMALVDAGGAIMEVNQVYCDILGYTTEELKQTMIKNLTYPEDWPNDQQLFTRIINGELMNWRYEKRYIHKDGSIIKAAVSGSVINDNEGNISGFLAQMQKISS